MRIKTLFYAVILFLLLSLFKVFSMGGTSLLAQNTRLWATYYGGIVRDYGWDVSTDASGNVYLAGYTESTSSIASGGFQNVIGGPFDAFLAKFDVNGNRLWATYYGGTNTDHGYNVTTDAVGNVYLAGRTKSSSSIASGGFQNSYGGGDYDAFLVKFDANGSRLWATYYGGTEWDAGYHVYVDASGNVYLTGQTNTFTSIASGGFQNVFGGGPADAFLVKFDANGSRLWATYYGGMEWDVGYSIASDASGNVYLSGYTESTSGIASGGFQNTYGGGNYDAFLVKFDASGSRLWATYYGGIDKDYGLSVATDAVGSAYLVGYTESTSGIALGGFQNIFGGGGSDAFLVKFNDSGIRLWATYYGGTDYEEGYSVATDAAGNVYLAGDTYSANGIASGGFQNSLVGLENAFVVKLSSSGGRLCATYYGQTHDEESKIAVDNSGNVYLAGFTPSASGIASGGFQNTYGGGQSDAYLVKFTSCGNNALSATTVLTNINCNGQCSGTATASPSGGNIPYTYSWNNGQTSSAITGLCVGTYSVIVKDALNDSVMASVTITEPPLLSATTTATPVACGSNNGTASVSASGGSIPYTYLWNPSGQTTPTATGLGSSNYTATVTDANGCTVAQTATVVSSGGSTNTNQSAGICFGSTYTLPSGTVVSTGGSYTDTLTSVAGCDSIITTNLTVNPNPTAAVLSNTTITQGQSATLTASGGGTYSWSSGSTENIIAVTPPATSMYCVSVTDTNNCTDTACVTVTIEPIDCSNSGELYLPNAFSPNGDGENDVLKIYYGNILCIKTLQLKIYDRWGEKVFSTTNPTAEWDGYYRDKLENAAVFVYYLEASLLSGEEIIRKGNVSILR